MKNSTIYTMHHCASKKCLLANTALSDKQLNSFRLTHLKRSAGHHFYEQGDSASDCFWLCEGTVQLWRRDRFGKKQFIRLVEPGQIFGLESLSDVSVYDQDAQALENCWAMRIKKYPGLFTLIKEETFTRMIVNALLNELLNSNKRLKICLAGGAKERIARALLQMPKRNQQGMLNLNITNEKLAALIGASPQTVSSCLCQLKNKGIISRKRGQISVLNPKELQLHS